jgi:hypothetical protein
MGGTFAAVVTVALSCSSCAREQAGPRPPPLRAVDLAPLLVAGATPQLDAPDVALSGDAFHVRALSASQARSLQRTLGRCLGPATVARGSSTARFRACAFRQLAHNSISQRLNAVLALTLARRLNDSDCRTSLLTLAGVTRALAGAAEGTLRELNSRPRWSTEELAHLAALRALTRDMVVNLHGQAWRRDCAPTAHAAGGP